MPFQLAMFDWNGTLLDDLGVTYAATTRLFKQIAPQAIVPTLEEYRQEFSSSQMLECYYARGVSRTITGDTMYRQWSSHYESICDSAVLADGSEKILRFLRQCGIPIILVSAAPWETIKHLEKLDVFHLFDRVFLEVRNKEGVIRQVLGHENIAPHDAFYVGDTTDDIAHGKQAGVVTFGYTKGYNSLDRMRGAKPKYIVDSLLDVLSIVRANIG